MVLVDATADGRALGTVTRLEPRFSKDYPKRLTAHDIGLKDLLDAFYLLGECPEVTLFAVSIDFPQPLRLGLSPALRRALPSIVDAVRAEPPSPVAAWPPAPHLFNPAFLEFLHRAHDVGWAGSGVD